MEVVEIFHRQEQESTATERTTFTKSCRTAKRRFRDRATGYSSRRRQQEPHVLFPPGSGSNKIPLRQSATTAALPLIDLSKSSTSFFISPPQSPNRPPRQIQYRQQEQYHAATPAHLEKSVLPTDYTVVTQSSDSEMDTAEDDDVPGTRRRRRHTSDRRHQRRNKKIRTTGSYPPPQRPNGFEWWKQNRKPTVGDRHGGTDLPPSSQIANTCHVCESRGEGPPNGTRADSLTARDDRHRRPETGGGRRTQGQKNSLLAYFRATTTAAPSPRAPVVPGASAPPPRPAALRTCHYCDRWCCATCVRTCERCAGGFCTFCSTINYDRPEERTFCLDCGQAPDDGGAGGGGACGDEDVVMDMR